MREELLMSKAELARKAGISVITLDRVESGKDCRMVTKRKLLKALGLSVADKEKVFN
jgi:DNA-binding XRE family transcriptional regulator